MGHQRGRRHRARGGSLGGVLATNSGPASAAVSCEAGSVVNVVAHPNDDLLFLGSDLVSSVQSGACVRTVFVTAGDANRDAAYWQSREAGSLAAYAEMAGVATRGHKVTRGSPGIPRRCSR